VLRYCEPVVGRFRWQPCWLNPLLLLPISADSALLEIIRMADNWRSFKGGDMSQVQVILLECARAQRDLAARARQLADGTTDAEVIAKLIAYAEEMEGEARRLEYRATALAKTVAKTRILSAELKSLVAEARASIAACRKTPDSKD